MDKLKIMIVEDELIVAEDIRNHLFNIGYTVTGIASSYAEATKLFDETLPDLVMLDIMIKGNKTGIDMGKYLREHNPSVPIIYLTSLSDKRTIEQAKETYPDAYLLKPFQAEHLFTSIEIAISKSCNYSKPSEEGATEVPVEKEKGHTRLKDSLFLKRDAVFYKVKIKDILYFHAEGNYLIIYLNNDLKYMVRSSVKDFLELVTDYMFFQAHKSYVINLEFVDVVTPSSVKIKNHEIPISRGKRDELMMMMQSLS